jgi:hypothetical protein
MNARRPFAALALLSSLGAIGAGAYLVAFNVIYGDPGKKADGWFAMNVAMGLYFIAKGLFIGPMLWLASERLASREEPKSPSTS